MRANITQEDIDIYASDPQAVKLSPDQTNYSLGVKVNWTAPAKWWNWLWNRMTSIMHAHISDTEAIRSEMTSVLAEAGLTPADGTKRQLSNSMNAVMFDTYKELDNLPHVQDHKIYLPMDEII